MRTLSMRARIGKDLRKIGVIIVEGYVCCIGSHEFTNHLRVERIL